MKKLLLGLLILIAFGAYAQSPVLPIDFDDLADDAWAGDGGAVYSLESAMFAPDVVGKIVGGTDQWNSRVNLELGTYIDMTTANKTFTFEFYTSEAVAMTGLFQIGLEKDGGFAIEMQFTTDGAIGWETITLDFNGATNAYPNAGDPVVYGNYAQVSIFTNFGDNGTSTYYFDDIAGAANGAVVGADPLPAGPPVPQPSADQGDVISLFSDAYASLATYWHPGWGQSTVYSDEIIPGTSPEDHIAKLKYFNYDAIIIDGPNANVGSMEYLHIDVWSIDATAIRPYLLTGPEPNVSLDIVAEQWNSFDIPLGDFVGANLAALWGIKFESGNWAPGQSPLVYLDNIYFWKTPGVTFDPLDGSTNVAIDINPTISFPMPIAMADDSPITNGDITSIVSFKETDASGADVPFTGTINPGEDLITIVPTSDLGLNKMYYLALNNDVVKYQGGALIEGQGSSFTTESGPFGLPVTFDEITVNYGVGVWGGNASAIIEDPTDPSNMVLETVDADYEWSGSFLGGPNGTGLDNPIPFTATTTQISMRVWSPEAGVPIIFKVENGSNGGIAAEVTVNTTLAAAWETMIFDLGGVLNFAEEYHKIVLLFNAGINEPGSTYYCDDIELLPPVIKWNGSVSTDWFDGNNWLGGVVPTFADDVVVPAGMPNDPVIETVDAAPLIAEVASITNEATITVNPLGYFSVYDTFTNNGSLLVLSDATYNGSFIYSGDLGGNFQYDRYLGADGTGVEGGWHYLSSPVAGFGSYNMYDYYINTWDEATGMWVQHPGDPQVPCTPAPEIFNDGMDGWSVNLDDDYLCEATLPGTGMTVEFMGAPNWGDQTGAITNLGTGDYAGFNLVGNPYPSYWDYDAYFLGSNVANIYDAIYYWDEDMMQYASYIWPNSTNGGGPYVPPGQAFFFEAAGDDVLTFTDAERTHVYNVPFWKNDTEVLKLRATANGYTDETVIHFNENSTVNRDKNDARKLISTASKVPTLYTKASGLAISINGMPATESVGMYFSCETAGTYTIEAVETGTFAYVVLEDMVTGDQTDLLAGAYTFDYTEVSDTRNFIVHFTPLGIGQLSQGNVNIWSLDNNIMVNVPANVTGEIAVYNMMGQEVVRSNIKGTETQIKVSDVNTNYVVKVISESSTVTGKIFVK